jgi:hypothetical protein
MVAACLWPTSPSEDPCVKPAKNDLERNICAVDADCQYIWFAGGCFTPEYTGKTSSEAVCMGMYPGEAPIRDGVTCTCEKKACVTHG